MKKCLLLLLLLPSTCLAWNMRGHEIIAQIAYDNLTPAAKQHSEKLIKILNKDYPSYNTFVTAAAWPDAIKLNGITIFNNWHFMAIPYSKHYRKHLPKIPANNLLAAYNQSITAITSKKTSTYMKAFFFRYVLHLVGDAHQPMHCISLYSKRFPTGDHGGNDFRLHNHAYPNLHKLWDSAFSFNNKGSIKKLAHELEYKYPKSFFGKKINDTNPKDWIHESYEIAKHDAYKIKYNSRPTEDYWQTNKRIAEQRLVLAGYRLAYVLNKTFSS